MTYSIRKSTGRKEPFDLKKFARSLKKAGAHEKLIKSIIRELEKRRPKSTKQIHEITLELLGKYEPPIAMRYNLKRALMELGPAGYPFEQFISQLFAHMGYKVATNQICSGICVDHEVDIIAQKGKKHFMIECKFHNRLGLKSDVKVALYIQARFEDIRQSWEQDSKHGEEFHQAWLVTNTRFTTEAIKYGLCRNMKLLGWSFPIKDNLAAMIDKLGLHPITALPSLSRKQKRVFIKNGFILCRDARKHKDLLKQMGFSQYKIEKLVKELEAVCAI